MSLSALDEVRLALGELRASVGYQTTKRANPRRFAETHMGRCEAALQAAIAKLTPPPPPPAPSAPPSVFKGRGMFTVERPQDAAGLKLDYVLRQASTYEWTRVGGGGVVYQDESADQYQWAKQGGASWTSTELALVTTLDASYHAPGSWPDGWACMPECYWNADGGKRTTDAQGHFHDVGRSIPNMLYRAVQVIGARWGTVPVVPVVGCYDASGENPGVGVRLTVPDYLPDLEWAMRSYPCVVGYAVWRVETLDPRDLAALR